MTYNKVHNPWHDDPVHDTPIDAGALNQIESGIEAAATVADTAQATATNLNAKIKTGAGSPEGVLTAPVATIYLRTDGTPNATMYVKESGVGNTGWVPRGASAGGITVSSTVAGLGTPASDGALGLIRIGVWPDQHEVLLRWNLAQSKWLSDPVTLVTVADQVGIHLQGIPDYITWQRFIEAMPYYKPARNVLSGPITLPTTPIGVVSTTNFTTTGAFKLRNQVVSYTGVTPTSFTGCTGGTGSYVTNEVVTQGDAGGWGTATQPILQAGAFWAAGLRLQENIVSHMNGNGTQALDIAAYWYQYNVGDNTAYTQPPSGGLGFSGILTGPTQTFVGVLVERPFQWKSTGWQTLTFSGGGNPSKTHLIPILYGRMNGGSGTVNETGEIVDTVLKIRWTS